MEEIALRNQKMATIVKSYLLNLPIIQQKRIAAIGNKIFEWKIKNKNFGITQMQFDLFILLILVILLLLLLL